jgi:hypothetical protein
MLGSAMVEYKGRTLDRIPQFDERSRGFAAVQPDDRRPFKNKNWTCDLSLDQGREGACVGFALAHELAATPKKITTSESMALEIYRNAQKIDPWPGEDYSGTSVLAGMKTVQSMTHPDGRPLIREYRWAFGLEDVMRVISYNGPVVLGIEWQSSFYEPDAEGRIWLNNDPVGGHAILAKGLNLVPNAGVDEPVDLTDLDLVESTVTLHNSWGEGYGDGGDCYINLHDLRHLLHDKDGEACIPLKRTRER